MSDTSALQFARLAPLAATLALHAGGVSALLDQRRVVHDEHRIRPAYEPVSPLR